MNTNNIPKRKLGLLAQDVIRDRADRPFYNISAYDYTVNPIIVNDDMYFCDYELSQDPKVFPECKIGGKIMNKIQISEEKLYDFLDSKVKESWIESCQSNSSLNGWVKRMYLQDDDLFITDNMSTNAWLEGEGLTYLGYIDSYIEVDVPEDEDDIDYDIEWSNWGRDTIFDMIVDNSFDYIDENFEII